MFSKSFASINFLIYLFFSFLYFGCVSHYHQKVSSEHLELNDDEIAEIRKYAGDKFKVPVFIKIISAEEMMGQNDSMWDGTPLGFKDLYHYPLRNIMSDCFNKIVYSVFEQPNADVINSFEMKIEPLQSVMTVDGDTGDYKLRIYVGFYEPGGKKLVSYDLDMHREGQIEDSESIPSVVYDVTKSLALESVRNILQNRECRSAIIHLQKKNKEINAQKKIQKKILSYQEQYKNNNSDDEHETLAVYRVESKSNKISDKKLMNYTDEIRNILINHGKFKILARKEMGTILKEKKAGKIKTADKILKTTIVKRGKSYIIQMKLLDVKDDIIDEIINEKVIEKENITYSIKDAAYKLLK